MSSTSMFRGFHSLHCPKAFWAVIYATALWGTFLSPCLPSHISCLFFLTSEDWIDISTQLISLSHSTGNWEKAYLWAATRSHVFIVIFSPIQVCPEYDAECLSQCSPNSYQACMRESVCVCYQTDCDVHQGHWFSLSSIRQLMYDSKEVHFCSGNAIEVVWKSQHAHGVKLKNLCNQC